jgi:hypothetical protein
MYSFLCKNTENSNKNCFGQVTFWGKVILFGGQALYNGPNFFFILWGLWVSKDAELNVDFKNINLYLRQNAPKRSKSRMKILFTTQGVLFNKNEYIPRVLSFKIKFLSKIDPPYCIIPWVLFVVYIKVILYVTLVLFTHVLFVPLYKPVLSNHACPADCV